MRAIWSCAAALFLGACYGDPDRFNEKQVELLCGARDECDPEGGWWDFHIRLEDGESCHDARARELDRCNASCDYDEEAARDCIRSLKGAVKEDVCSLDTLDFDRCAEVYRDCEDDDDDDPLQCAIEPPRFTAEDSWSFEWGDCSVVPHREPPLCLLALVGLATWRLRRASRARSRPR